jgi:TonB family protein
MMNDSSFYVNGKRVGTSIGWYPNGYIYDSLILDKNGKGVIYGWFDNGNPGYVGKYSEGEKKDGIWKYFHKNGKLSSLETYKDGKIIDKKYYNEEGGEVKDTTTKEIEASFTGGKEGWKKYLVKNLKYPSKYTIKNTDRAAVTVTFTVNEDGKVDDVFPSTPFYLEFDKAAIEVIKNSPNWIPALQNNRHVKYTMRQTITFVQ